MSFDIISYPVEGVICEPPLSCQPSHKMVNKAAEGNIGEMKEKRNKMILMAWKVW
jgi:hypothetical protein